MSEAKEARVNDLAKWITTNLNTECVNDSNVDVGAEFLARCIVRANPFTGDAVYPLSEFMQEKGITDKAEAESLFLEMFRQANRLMGSYHPEGIYFNYIDSLDMSCAENIVRLGHRYLKVLKGNGKLPAEEDKK